ncbi:hypothetical protein [Roseovarius aestuariivivens]|nr:hypothetical protein [Roseovarius aestuariivivens]
MFNILSRTFHTATRQNNRWDTGSHWSGDERFATRDRAELEAHQIARRRF